MNDEDQKIEDARVAVGNRIENKVDNLQVDVTDLKIIAAEQHIILKDHIKRTELLERAIVPMTAHLHFWSVCAKLGVWGAGILTAAAAIAELLGYLHAK